VLGRIIGAVGPCTLKRSSNYFLTLVEAILWQQLSWHAATAIQRRMLQSLGTRRPRPEDFLSTPRHVLVRAGLSRQKIEYLRNLSSFFCDGDFPRRRIGRLSDEKVVETLTTVKGIGRWSAEMFLIFGLNRLDVFPLGDLGLKKAVGKRYGTVALPDEAQLSAITDVWRPYRTIAAWYLWASIDGVPFADGTAS
jgi:DNA-3-methyladenine glycosylase II